MNNNVLGLYVHIPFCIKKCNYCDFNSYSGCYNMQQPYFDALFCEIKNKAAFYGDFLCDSIYIGGGTPTSVETKHIVGLVKELKKYFNISKDAEVTVECNPKTAGIFDFEEYLKCGINRLSIGRQSAEDDLLEILGRIHTNGDFEVCLAEAKAAGFKNISADLMFALPGQSLEVWENTLLSSADCGLSHLSCYGLKIEEGTPFYDMKLELPDEDLCADMYERCVEILEKNGYMRYEISNFAKAGAESVHNLKYWSHKPYIGLGAGAYSSFLSERYSNSKNIFDYITQAKDGRFLKNDYVSLSKKEQMSEFMFMGLRKTEGINLEDFKLRFGEEAKEVFGAPLAKHLKTGAMEEINGNLRINKKLLYISNLILCDFV